MAGPLYAYDAANPSTTKFPEWFNDRYFYFDWTTDWVQTVAFNPDGSVKDRSSSCRSTRSSSRWT